MTGASQALASRPCGLSFQRALHTASKLSGRLLRETGLCKFISMCLWYGADLSTSSDSDSDADAYANLK